MSKTITEWTVRIRCKKFELGGSFSVLLFFFEVPDVPDNPNKWSLDPRCVGSFNAYVDEEPEDGDGQGLTDATISGFVHINDSILKQSPQQSLDPDNVVPFLKEHLYWRVLKEDGSVPELSSLPSLEVMVLATPLTQPVGAPFPEVGKPVYYPDITRGKAGGVTHAT